MNKMIISVDKRLFWFLKEGARLDLSEPSQLDMYVQQVLTCGRGEDVRNLFRNAGFDGFKSAFLRLRRFLPLEVRKFWEDFLGNNQ